MLYSSRWKFVLPSCSICSFIVAWSTHEAKKVEKGAGARIKIDPSINFVSNSQALMDFYPKSVLPIIRQTRKSLGIFFISTRFFFTFFNQTERWEIRWYIYFRIHISIYSQMFWPFPLNKVDMYLCVLCVLCECVAARGGLKKRRKSIYSLLLSLSPKWKSITIFQNECWMCTQLKYAIAKS